jgi:hypothetical protein
VRELEKEIRSLRQQLRQYEKYQRNQDEEERYDSEDTYPNLEIKLTKPCEQCGPGKGVVVETLEIMGKTYGTCNTCGYNDRIK